MFGLSKRGSGVAGTATLIAPGTTVRGDIEFAGQLIVSGLVEGNVCGDDGNATLIVSASGRVAGEVRVPQVEVHGCVSGDVHASTHVKLASEAQVNGDVHYKVIEIAEGADVNGRLLRDSPPMTERQAAEQQAAGRPADVDLESVREPGVAPVRSAT